MHTTHSIVHRKKKKKKQKIKRILLDLCPRDTPRHFLFYYYYYFLIFILLCTFSSSLLFQANSPSILISSPTSQIFLLLLLHSHLLSSLLSCRTFLHRIKMADLITPDIETVQESTSKSRPAAKGDDTPDVQSTETKMEMMKQQSKEAYKDHENLRDDDDEEEKPGRVEVVGWYMYGFCTYFIHSVLIPIVFPLIIAQTVSSPPQPVQGWDMSPRGLVCREKESKL